MSEAQPDKPLRRGWTTGACASGAARAAFEALLTGAFPDPVPVALPKGLRPEFALATQELGEADADVARAGIVKDAGDDPDVTHGALIVATVRLAPKGAGVSFRAGEGVGTVTRPGLPLPPGEPAINPAPRAMIRANLDEVAERLGVGVDLDVEISIPGGAKIAERTANGRLGIVGGLSILGTTGVVVPYSCSAWIHSIHSGVDVARASGLAHIGAATGETSGAAIRALYRLPDHALIEMGDFAGGFLKHLRAHPVAARHHRRRTGENDQARRRAARPPLEARRGRSRRAGRARLRRRRAASLTHAIAAANSGLHAFELAEAAGFDLPALVAERRGDGRTVIAGAPVELEIWSSAATGGCSPAAGLRASRPERRRRATPVRFAEGFRSFAGAAAKWWIAMGQSADPKEDITRGDELVSQALAADPNFAAAHMNKANTIRMLGRLDEAVAENERGLVLDPAFVDAYAGLGFDHLNLGQFEKSVDYFDKAIRLSPHDPYLYGWYGMKSQAHFCLKQYEQTIEWARRSIAISANNNPLSQGGLTAALALAGHGTDASEALQRYLALPPTGPRTIAAWKANNALFTNPQSDPRILECDDRMIEGLRKAGMPET